MKILNDQLGDLCNKKLNSPLCAQLETHLDPNLDTQLYIQYHETLILQNFFFFTYQFNSHLSENLTQLTHP